MNLFGDLERLFATALYPNRVPIAIGLALLGIALLVTARRRGWFAAARRHPRRTALLVALALVIGLPTGWYLGSPLFIQTTLVEPAPATGAPSAGPGTAATRSGTFRGADEFHFGSGTAKLVETAPGRWTVRFEGFSVRNGPDLFVYLSPDAAGFSAAAINLGALKATDGSFNMEVPAGTDVTRAASVVIWCKQFAVLFALAPLQG